MREDGRCVGLVKPCEYFLGEREHVVGDLAGGVREGGSVLGREVVRGTVDSESGEAAGYFGFGTLLVGTLGELFEFRLRRRGALGEHCGGAGKGTGGSDGADRWVIFRL